MATIQAQPQATIGVFGGSGFYSFLEDVSHIQVHTPYGAPSDSIAIGTIGGVSVAFLPRHGAHHQTPAHMVNFRANLWAMREIGVERIVGPCAAGSLKPELAPGDIVILDQFVDRTSARKDTFFDGGIPGHVSMADPYCPEMAETFADAGRHIGLTVHEGGTVVTIQGPRFSTRAESQWFRSFGWDVVNMTQYPEVALARELGMCYSGLALVTDYDTGVEGEEHIKPVEMNDVFAMLKANVDKTRTLLSTAIPSLVSRGCNCGDSINGTPLAPTVS